MCGVAGFYNSDATEIPRSVLISMADCISHRGPDDVGFYMPGDREGNIQSCSHAGLGHQRLSILDVSQAGHQPMFSKDGRFVIVFNGEIYNHHRVRERIQNETPRHQFHSNADTETILDSWHLWGPKSLSQFVGMFAFGLYDSREDMLIVCRDRIGIKPLYYFWDGVHFAFASEIGALKSYPFFNLSLDQKALAGYLMYGYIPSPWSIFENCYKLNPGEMITVSKEGLQTEYYWSVGELLQEREIHRLTEKELIDEADKLIRESVELRLLSDVPLGALLSGGIDSTTVVAVMQTLMDQPVKTFTIGFHKQEYDEAPFAREISQYVGTEHHEYYIDPDEVIDLLQDAVRCMDEPISDPSLLPTMLVSAYARNYVTVALTGDGGDEIFYGYRHYFRYSRLKRYLQFFHMATTKPASRFVSLIPLEAAKTLTSFPPIRSNFDLYINLLTPARANDLRRILVNWDNGSDFNSIYRYASQASDYIDNHPDDPISAAFYDLQTVLPDQLLTKVDRASMRVALEARVPLLDHRLVEFSLRLPFEMLYRDGESKYILKQVLRKYLPDSLVNQDKKGFSIPLNRWVKDELRPEIDHYLSKAQLEPQGLFNYKSIEEMKRRYLNNQSRHGRLLWSLLIFQLWYEGNFDDRKQTDK